jgi:hypothetical protein
MREKGGFKMLLKELPTIPYTRIIKMPVPIFPVTTASKEDLKIFILANKLLELSKNPYYRYSNRHFKYNYDDVGFGMHSRAYNDSTMVMGVVVIHIWGHSYIIFHARLMNSQNKNSEVML